MKTVYKFFSTAIIVFFINNGKCANKYFSFYRQRRYYWYHHPNALSILEMVSTSKGLLVPRMTKTQRDNIAITPPTGLLIYQTNNTPGFYYYDGSAWTAVTPKSKGWSLTGNSGTNPATNFIGTTDAQPLVFKVNNTRAGYLDNINANTSFGYQALISNTGIDNTATGGFALALNTTGYYNTATGALALYNNTDGIGNTANGTSALFYNTGSNNTATGLDALYANTTGYSNVAIGTYSLFNTTGCNNQCMLWAIQLLYL